MTEHEKLPLREHPAGCICEVRIKPGSSRSRVEGIYDGRIIISVHARPQKGKANREALRVLADLLGAPPSLLEIARGEASRNKSVLVRGRTIPEIQDVLSSLSVQYP